MRTRLDDKYKAIALRQKGYSYREIMSVINVSKGTLSGWINGVEFSKEQLDYIYLHSMDKQNQGRVKAGLANHKKKLDRILISKNEAIEEFEIFKNDTNFLIGLSLYWAEGTKKDSTFSFINSDSDMIKFMIKWTQKYLKIEKNLFKIRPFMHLPYANENLEKYWSEIIGIKVGSFQKTIYKPTRHQLKKNPTYKGCLRFYVNGISYKRKVAVWQQLLVNCLKM